MSWSIMRNGKASAVRLEIKADFDRAAQNCASIPSELATLRAIAAVVDAELEAHGEGGVTVECCGSVSPGWKGDDGVLRGASRNAQMKVVTLYNYTG